MTDQETENIRCALCGVEFDPEENACGGCVMYSGCHLIRCPNCGFETVKEESSLINAFKRVSGFIRKIKIPNS